MQEKRFGYKLVVAGEVVFLLFKELSFGQCLLLQMILFMIVWTVMQGGAMIVGALPTWAIALSVAGFATILFTTFRTGNGKYGAIALGMCVTMMLGSGAASVTTPDADGHGFGGRLPSLNDLVVIYAWMMAVCGFVGGLIATCAYVDWARSRRVEREGAEGRAQ